MRTHSDSVTVNAGRLAFTLGGLVHHVPTGAIVQVIEKTRGACVVHLSDGRHLNVSVDPRTVLLALDEAIRLTGAKA